MRAHAVGVLGRPLRAAAAGRAAAGDGHVEALVGADEDDDRVRLVLGDLARRELAPVDEAALGDARAELRLAQHLHLPVALGERARQLDVERHRHRVAGHQQRVERAGRRRLGAQRGGVERVRRDRRERAAARRGHGLVEAARVADAVLGADPVRRLRGPLVEGQLVGDPAGRVADREHDVALDAGIHLLAGVADRGALEQHQQHHGQQHDADRRTGAQAPAGGRLGNGLVDGGHVRTGSR